MTSKRQRLLIAIFSVSLALVPIAYGTADEETKHEKKKAATETITGVIDQSDGTFVLATEDRIRPIAKLRGDGFKDTNFARFLGLKVRVKGEMRGNGDEKTLIIRSLDDIEKIGPTNTR